MSHEEDVAKPEWILRKQYAVPERTTESERRAYDEMRAERRIRSKATIIGLFSNAKKHLYSLKTVSGADDDIGFLELYRDAFCDYLESQGCVSDENYSLLLSEINGYRSVWDFLCNDIELNQKIEMAAFGLILYDRLVQAASSKASYSDFFLITIELDECLDYVTAGDDIKKRAQKAALARHANDPKQADKAIVRECWNTWQKNPGDYKSKSAFALDMLKQFPRLESQRVITEKWCPAWEKENTTLPAK